MAIRTVAKTCKQIISLLVLMTSVSAASVTNVVTLKDVFEAANAIRANPSSYANVVKTLIRDQQDADGVIWTWGSVGLAFNEGTAAVDEAITFLQNATPKPALTLDQGLVRSSWEHSKYQVEIN